MEGTASRVRRWLIVEQPGPWGADVPVDSRMDADLARTLRSRAQRHGARVLLVRRPGWVGFERRRMVTLAHTTRRHTWAERLELDDDGLRDLDLGVLAAPGPPGLGEPSPALHLVCTNGRHDPCCADLGRPVVRALVEAGVPEVWESSHVGGDRFAANVVCLPTGVYYGRVEPATAPDLLADLADGFLHLEHYRGRCVLSSMAQAAEVFFRREVEERRLDAVEVTGATEEAGGVLAVDLAIEGAVHRVRVRREPGEEEHLTCRANGTSRPWRHRLVDISSV